MRVAVTGATGFIGRHLIMDPSHDWVALTRRPAEWAALDSKTEYVTTDYSMEGLEDALEGVGALVHLASAKTNRASGDTARILLENVDLAQNVFSACAASAVNRVIHVSSRMVYGPDDEMPWSERADVHPSTYYGLSKLCCEKLARVILHPETSKEAIHLRIPQVLGVPGSGADEHVITTFLRNASVGDDLVVLRDVKRQYIYIRDVVAAILHALAAKDRSGVFNVAMADSVSVKDAALDIADAFGGESEVRVEAEGAHVRHDVLMDLSKAEADLGFVSRWPFCDTIADIAAKMR